MINTYAILQVGVIALVTFLLRALPFVIFTKGKETPAYITYLGKVLPMAIMGMLVVYCLKGTHFHTLEGWMPGLVAAVGVVILHAYKRNTLLSVLGGTILYMILIH